MRPAHLQAGIVQEVIREHITSCGAKIGSVLFVKKDSTVRLLRYQQAAMPSRIKGTERGIKASATRAVNHPNLMTVFDVARNPDTGKAKGFRTVDLDTVLTVKAGGKVTRYRDVERVRPGVYELVPLVTIKIGIEEESKP